MSPSADNPIRRSDAARKAGNAAYPVKTSVRMRTDAQLRFIPL